MIRSKPPKKLLGPVPRRYHPRGCHPLTCVSFLEINAIHPLLKAADLTPLQGLFIGPSMILDANAAFLRCHALGMGNLAMFIEGLIDENKACYFLQLVDEIAILRIQNRGIKTAGFGIGRAAKRLEMSHIAVDQTRTTDPHGL